VVGKSIIALYLALGQITKKAIILGKKKCRKKQIKKVENKFNFLTFLFN